MRTTMKALLLAVLIAIGTGALVVTTSTAATAATTICDQYGTTTVGGKYIVQNNRWGTSATQCISVTDTGFSIIQQDGTGNLGGAPTAYPSIYLGCHYGNCSPGSPLPAQISQIASAPSSISDTYPGSGTYDASYDIWLNADTNVSGVQDTEIMIWLNHTGSINPVGSATGTATLAGHTWTVWTGNNGANNVVSYVQSGLTGLSFNVKDFITDTLGRGSAYGTTSWYLTSIQAGFEPWIGGVGLAVNSFSASITTGGGGSTPPPTPTPTPTPTPPGGGGAGPCSATYSLVNAWSGGFQAGVTVTAGSAAIHGWTVHGTWPSGQAFTQLWNGALSTSGSSFTVGNLSYNGSTPAHGTQSFGFTGSGTGLSSLPLTCTAS